MDKFSTAILVFVSFLVLAPVVGGCAESHTAPPVDAGPAQGADAGCVFQWGCVGEACPAQDVQDGIWFPCELARSSEDRDR